MDAKISDKGHRIQGPSSKVTRNDQAIDTNISDVLKRGAFRVTRLADLPANANLLSARFKLAIKSSADGRIRYKAQHGIGGYRDRMKLYLVHDSQTDL